MEALLTPEEVAERLRLTPHTIYAWLRQGRLPGIKLGTRWRVKTEDLDACLDSGRCGTLSAQASDVIDGMELFRMADEVTRGVPQEAWAGVPRDLGADHDHYLYGCKKREGA